MKITKKVIRIIVSKNQQTKSCASLLLAKGIPMKAIQEWLGHSNFSTTANLYAHLDVNSKKLSADALVNALKFTDTKKENEESTSSSSKNN